jgi:hypothetical protein
MAGLCGTRPAASSETQPFLLSRIEGGLLAATPPLVYKQRGRADTPGGTAAFCCFIEGEYR